MNSSASFFAVSLLGLVLSAPLTAQCLFGGAQRIDANVGGFGGLLENGDRFGRSVVGIGDLDSDGVLDVAVGARSDDDGGIDCGAVWILFMNPDKTVRDEAKISNLFGNLPPGLVEAGDWFGYTLALVGDMDGDGMPTLAVGAPNDDDGAGNAGAVYLFELTPAGSVASTVKISNAGNLPGSLLVGDSFGMGMGFLGDLDGDGQPELGVAAPLADSGGTNRGRLHLLSLAADGTVAQERRIAQGVGGFTGVFDNNDQFGGRAVCALGDVNGDGTIDLAVGTFRDDDGGPDRGAFYVLFLNSSLNVIGHQKVSNNEGDLVGPLEDGDLFGMTLAPLGDINYDGVPDVAVGNNLDDVGLVDAGSMFLLSLTPQGTVLTEVRIDRNNFPGLNLPAGDRFGRAMGVVGDMIGDGSLTLGVGAGAGQGGGAIYLITLDACGCITTRHCSPPAANSVSAGGAIFGVIGTGSIIQDAIVLGTNDLPTGQFALFFMGSGVQAVAVGNGVLCPGAPLLRLLPALPTGSVGGVGRVFHPSSLGLQPGDTRVFQCWYRDPAAGGALFNFSDAVEVRFCR